MMYFLTSRKFLAFMALMAVSAGFVISGHMTGSEFIDLMKVTFVSYSSSNVGEHTVTALKEWFKNKVSSTDKEGQING